MSTTAGGGKTRTFFGHPWGLANLFGIEMWERFSYYGMVTILGYYLYYAVSDGGLGMERGTALSLVGAYGGFVYITSVAAAFISDRILGPERTLLFSAILVMAGHILLAVIPGYAGLTLGLVSIAVGSGGVKTASQVVLGDLYTRQDPKRDAGFSLFYMGVNIGALFGPLLTGEARSMGGFHWGFALAAIGMALGLTQYIAMRKSTLAARSSVVPNPLPREQYLRWGLSALVGIAAVVALFATGIVGLDKLALIITATAGIIAVVLMVQMFLSPLTTAEERSRLVGYLPILLGCVMFFAIFQSQFTILTLYTDTRVNLSVNLDFGRLGALSFNIEPNQVQSINPFFIIVFSGVFAAMWTKLGSRQWSSSVKFGVANLIIGASLFLFLPYAGGEPNSTPLLIIVALLFLFTMGELLLSPVGNSLATKVAPQAFKSRMFAVWLMAIAMGTSLSGSLGSLYESAMETGAEAERTFFLTTAGVAIALGVVLIALRKWVVRKFIDVR
ncbi:peptide MFS transporter [Corynebacterium lowii]|uniref:Di-/tripeptide transporter n=1 Tax=Corynebacterium lowii TaxID=1544413 RepID=A0A0Q1AJQ3_9CORY|nr:oligopeptide:H+ symporter [Corynebacterium lowii]KQB87096.1 Di-/tripeptide transporter [Corynebacterium lowii]MDP9852319.1 POT family proton-dependent oligopeptide transporter [Corynebacterium lowii]